MVLHGLTIRQMGSTQDLRTFLHLTCRKGKRSAEVHVEIQKVTQLFLICSEYFAHKTNINLITNQSWI